MDSEQARTEGSRSRWSGWLVLGLGVLVLLAALWFAPLAFILGDAWWRDAQLPRGFSQEKWAAQPDRRQHLADDLIAKRVLIGKSPDQCLRLLGAPDSTGTVSELFSAEPIEIQTEGRAENTYETMTIPGDTSETVRAYFNLGPTDPIPLSYASWVLGSERSVFSIDSEQLTVGFSRGGIASCAAIVTD